MSTTRTSVVGNQRFRGGVSCPICGGSEDDDRGSGTRCYGFIGSDGEYAHCTREEHAGGLLLIPNSQTFPHKLKGDCKCGVEHGPADPKPPKLHRKGKSKGPIEREYDYRDESGNLLFQAVRYKSKDFIQRRPNGKGGWEWSLGDTRRVLYRLPELIGADPALPVFVVEGEKDVDNLRAIGLVATCNPMGALKWRDEYSLPLADRLVNLIGDNDKDGQEHVRQVAGRLDGIAREIRILDLAETCRRLGLGELAEKGDVSDFLAMGGTADALRRAFAAVSPLPRVQVDEQPSRNGVNGRACTGSDLGARHGRDGTPPSGGPGGGGPGDGVPVITITTAEYLVIDQAVDALADAPNVYQRGNMLMSIVRDDTPKNRIILRPPGSPRIAPLPLASLRELLTRCAWWEKTRKTRDGDEETGPAHPPDWAVAGVAARGSWPEIRLIEAVTETPVLRLDGTILDRPGYDERTGLLYEPNAPFLTIRDSLSLGDARCAAEALMELVGDFPFASEYHRAAWLVALLTPLARFAIAGPCPLFLIDANTPGTGKSKLIDVISTIATGRPIPRTAYPDNDDEMRKRISSIALAGDRMMLLDNIATTFGGSSLDSALTAMTWRDRILGRSEMTAELPLFTVWYGTGNNVVLRGDVLRRIIPCRLETREERPEERREFAIKGDLLEHVRRERPRLVAEGLTLLRAHAIAGSPDGGLTPLGSFEAWSLRVRSAVYWATGLDPCRTREELRATDPESLARTALVEGWLDLPEGRTGLTAAEAIKLVKENPLLYETVRAVFMEWSKTDDLPSACSLGNRLKGLKGRVINGKRLLSRVDRGVLLWRVEPVPAAD